MYREPMAIYICIYVYIYIMSAHAYMNICFWGVLFYWFVLSILSGLILFHNLALGYMLENVIFILHIYTFYLMMNFLSCLVMGYPLDWHDFSPI